MNGKRATADWATIVCVVAGCAGILGLFGGELNDNSPLALRIAAFEDGADPDNEISGSRAAWERLEESVCVEHRQGLLYGFRCNETLASARGFSAPNDVRRALHLLPCWWHADVNDVARVRGISWSYAALAIKLRNEHWPMALEQIKIREELGSRGPKIAQAFTEECSLHPLP